MTNLEAYEALLRRHDWHYGRSDDPKVVRKGQSEASELHCARTKIDPQGDIWNSIAPADFHVAPLVSRAQVDPRDAEIATLKRHNKDLAGRADRLRRAIEGVVGHPDLGIEAHRQLRNALDLEQSIETLKARKAM